MHEPIETPPQRDGQPPTVKTIVGLWVLLFEVSFAIILHPIEEPGFTEELPHKNVAVDSFVENVIIAMSAYLPVSFVCKIAVDKLTLSVILAESITVVLNFGEFVDWVCPENFGGVVSLTIMKARDDAKSPVPVFKVIFQLTDIKLAIGVL